MSPELSILAISAASIGFLHTLLGPDHYVPFIAMSRAGSWTLRKTALITTICGLGHVFGSVLLGSIGIALGIAISSVKALEALRGDLAAWALIAFGLGYTLWGLRRAVRAKPHDHSHAHASGMSHNHSHTHFKEHSHVHPKQTGTQFSPWALFVIFVLGPCEPLIPLLMYPAARGSQFNIVLVVSIFTLVTLATMLGVVILSSHSIRLLPLSKLERFGHALAGASILVSGMGIKVLGL